MRLWYIEDANQLVLKNGFYTSNHQGNKNKKWKFYKSLDKAVESNTDLGNISFLLCQVCVNNDCQNSLQEDGTCELGSGFCANPELCLRLK